MTAGIHGMMAAGGGASWTPAQATTDGGVSPEHWYRADDAYQESARSNVCDETNDVVGSITDKTTNADHISQGTADNKPLWIANVINGHPVIRFDGSNDTIQGAFTTGGSLSQPNTIIILAKMAADEVNDNLHHFYCDGDDGSNRNIVMKNSGPIPDKVSYNAGTNLYGDPPTGDFIIFLAVFNGNSGLGYKNGILDASGAIGSDAIDGVTLASKYDGNYVASIDFVEYLIYNSVLSVADMNQIGNYVATRYWLSWTTIE